VELGERRGEQGGATSVQGSSAWARRAEGARHGRERREREAGDSAEGFREMGDRVGGSLRPGELDDGGDLGERGSAPEKSSRARCVRMEEDTREGERGRRGQPWKQGRRGSLAACKLEGRAQEGKKLLKKTTRAQGKTKGERDNVERRKKISTPQESFRACGAGR
jgi:hypothetical protein